MTKGMKLSLSQKRLSNGVQMILQQELKAPDGDAEGHHNEHYSIQSFKVILPCSVLLSLQVTTKGCG